MQIVIGVALVLVVVAGGLWALGKAEPTIIGSGDKPTYFAAIKLSEPDATLMLAPGIEPMLVTVPEFTFVGPQKPYWDRYMLLSGDAGGLPVVMDDAIGDAYVARVTLSEPPLMVLGALRLAQKLGLTALPKEMPELEALKAPPRPEVLPDSQAVTTLTGQDAGYRPHMMNFLKYLDRADYPESYERRREVSGRTAYGRYGLVAMRTVMATGGAFIFHGQVDDVLMASTGWTQGSDWDDLAMMRYPNPTAILTMEHSEAYLASLVDRDAGLERTVVVSSSPR